MVRKKCYRKCIQQYMTSVNKLDDTVNKYSNTYHSKIKMKLAVVKSNTYIYSSKILDSKDPKFKTGDIVRTSKYQNTFAKGYTTNWSEVVVVIKKVKNTVLWTCY